MSQPLRVLDSLCSRVLTVDALQKIAQVIPRTDLPGVDVFAVMSEEGHYLGLVTTREAGLFPERIFADLLIRRQPDPLPQNASLHQALTRMEQEKIDYLPVCNAAQQHVGIISRNSVFQGLLKQEQRLLCERRELTRHLETELSYRRTAQTVFDSTTEGVLVSDHDNCIIQVNPAFIRTTGYSEAEAIGQTPHLLSSGRHDSAFYQQMWQTLLNEGVWQGEIWNRRKNGEIYPEWLTINCIRDESGRIHQYVAVFSDISKRREMQDSLHRLAYYDSLTRLPNRLLFHDRLQQAIAHSDRNGTPFALLFIDLDNFKQINDAFGHRYGDEVLLRIGEKLLSTTRKSDTAARLGGDEFAMLLLDQTDETSTARVAEQILQTLSGHLHIEEREIFITGSIGIALYPQDGPDAEHLLRSADIAMYRAKDAGRERICYFQPDMARHLSERLAIENTLRHAYEQGRFRLVWQPQIRLDTSGIIGAEILLRCHCSDEMGEIPPSTFIPIAENNGFINVLGHWTFATALEQLRAQAPSAEPSFRIAINLSLLQLNETTTRQLQEIGNQFGRLGLRLELEITESALMKDSAGTRHYLKTLSEAGIEITVDDFGTGYSNLMRLKELPINRLKIDQSFIRELHANDPCTQQIVRAIIDMGHALQLQVLAEGVETQEQADLLRSMGCDEAQGFLYHHPLESTSFIQLLQSLPARLH